MFFRKNDPLQFFQRVGGKSLTEAIQQADRSLSRYEKRFGGKRRAALPWQGLGAVKQYALYERGVRLACERGWVELHWIAPDCLRVRLRLRDDDFLPPFSYAVNKVDWGDVEFSISADRPDALEIRTAALVCRVGKQPFRLAVETLAGKRVSLDNAGPQWRADGAVRLSLSLHPDESCYGLGARAGSLNLRGRRLSLWNAEPSKTLTRDSDPLHCSIPFYLGLHQDSVYGILWDNSSRGTVDLGAAASNELTFEAESGELRYYIFAGATVNDVLERYTELTGRIKLPPLWALGYHQSRFSYFPQESVLALADEFRRRGVPCDALYLDIHYMHQFQVFTWDYERFPGAPQMIKRLHEAGFKVAACLNPGIRVDDQYLIYKSGLARNIFMKYPDGESFVGALWAGVCHLPDFTSPIARAWWSEQFDSLLRPGIDGVVNDIGEPSLFGAEGSPVSVPDFVEHDQDGLKGDHLTAHNIYGMLMARASLEALERGRQDRRQFNVLRAGFAGVQRYGFAWTGDNKSDWEHLRQSIGTAINLNLSGMPLVGANVGGFDDEPDGELFTRWLQAACLLPYFRNHTALGTKPQEPWSYGQPYEVINRVTIQLRYRLLPYLYSVVALCREFGYPVIRPLWMADPRNPALRAVDDSYLVGDSLLVAPVLHPGVSERRVFLPAGAWYDFWTNEPLKGGQTITVTAPLERLPLFVRAGTVLPLHPEMNYTREKAVEPMTLRVYPGKGDSVHYEDDGEGLTYLQGEYRWIYTSCEWDDNQFIIKRRTAGRYESPYKAIRVEVVSSEEPTDVRIGLHGAPLWFYDDNLLEVSTDDKTFGTITIVYRGQPHDPTVPNRPW
jgi:alpha-glucosidase